MKPQSKWNRIVFQPRNLVFTLVDHPTPNLFAFGFLFFVNIQDIAGLILQPNPTTLQHNLNFTKAIFEFHEKFSILYVEICLPFPIVSLAERTLNPPLVVESL